MKLRILVEIHEVVAEFDLFIRKGDLIEKVSPEDRQLLIRLFMEDPEGLLAQIREAPADKRKVMILSDPVCDLATRRRLMRDIIEQYAKDAVVFIKPHPRDALSYDTEEFSDCIVIRGRFPMEMMNYFEELHM
ncbi:MAG: hypothetical protein IK096_03295, partial [Lachnospiraceae bacterium]|nr:hypothetical protein [Lachnospiraceae bacterium]